MPDSSYIPTDVLPRTVPSDPQDAEDERAVQEAVKRLMKERDRARIKPPMPEEYRELLEECLAAPSNGRARAWALPDELRARIQEALA